MHSVELLSLFKATYDQTTENHHTTCSSWSFHRGQAKLAVFWSKIWHHTLLVTL